MVEERNKPRTIRRPHVTVSSHKEKPTESGEDKVRLVPLGGLEEIGRNMSFIEYKDEIVIMDVGIQFPEEETPGIDFIIPNISYLETKKANVKAIVLTHGHLDHIGALSYLTKGLGNPTVYTARLTKALIEKRHEEFVNVPKLNVIAIDNWQNIKLGKYLEITFFGVDHTIPDSCGVIVKTPAGNIVNAGDFRVDYDQNNEPQRMDDYKKIGQMGVHTFMVDSTNAEEPGRSLSEKVVEKNLEDLFKLAEGRIVLSTFSSMLTRMAEIIKICEKIGRKVALNGRSMKDNVQIAQTLGYMKFKKDSVIPVEEVSKHKDDKILVLTTGAQGESNAGLMRIVMGEHRHIRVKPGDTFIFSSSVIPGNERSVQKLRDNLSRQGAIVYHSDIIDIHSSGHAPKEDLQMVIKALKPKFLMPIHGYYYMRAVNGKNGVEAGVHKDNIRLMDNGQVATLTEDSFVITKEEVPANYIMVDGLDAGDVNEIVLRDRRLLAQEGMVVLIVTIDRKTGKVLKNPDIISRGFVYLKEKQGLLDEIRKKVRLLVGRIPNSQNIDADYLKTLFRDQIGIFLYNKTHRRPMILPVIIEI